MSSVEQPQPQPPMVLALDISKTCTGICFGRAGEVPRFTAVRGNDLDGTAAMMLLGHWLIDWIRIEKPDFVYYEAPVSPAAFMGKYDEDKGKVQMTSNPHTAQALFEMTGVVKFICGMKHIATRCANVQTVRKAFLGQARPQDPKKRVKAMCDALGWLPRNMDEADAGAVWYFATQQVAPRFYAPITPMTQAKVSSMFPDQPKGDRPITRRPR
jgi:hypothetical protein